MSSRADLFRRFNEYFIEVRRIFLDSNFTEMTFRTALETLIRSSFPNLSLLQEPQRKRGIGAPDFQVFKGLVKIGYIETKEPNRNLDSELDSEQLKKYKESINNIILTNYNRFILIRNSQSIFDLTLFRENDLGNSKFEVPEFSVDKFIEMIDSFASFTSPTYKSSSELAFDLAKKARILKELAIDQLIEDTRGDLTQSSSLTDFYQAMGVLIRDISVDDCADAFAQTIVFGYFLSKLNNKDTPISRTSAAERIPRNMGIIRKVFLNLSDSLPPNMSWLVDDIIDVLNHSDIKGVLDDIGERVKARETSFIMFYEDFLRYFDPKKRKHLGVYYTPRPVVSFISNAVNDLLKSDFKKLQGFADDSVTILDFATGTGTFLRMIYLLTLLELKSNKLSGLIPRKIQNHLLKDFIGFELLITPYVIAHVTLDSLLKTWFYELRPNDKIQVYLTNTLEPVDSHSLMPFMKEITEESHMANEIKTRRKILAIVGNPPYSGVSSNKGKWIETLLKVGYKKADGVFRKGYYEVDGKPLNERKVWLQDDYVKFIRFAQWKIDISGEGIVGVITNHAYLDNPTFRGMRQSLMNTFNRIYIINLHGNSLRKEQSQNGEKDENVFDIQQGVAISIFIKNENYIGSKLFYTDIFGSRKEKYSWLDNASLKSIKWTEISPFPPFYLFVPTEREDSVYSTFIPLTDIFPQSVTGIVTSRDDFVTDFEQKKLKNRIDQFCDRDISDDYIKQHYKLSENYAWRLSSARKELMSVENRDGYYHQILYRPFDTRNIFFHSSVVWRTRDSLMNNFLKPNLGLVTVRQVAEGKFSHVLITDKIVDNRLTSSNKGIAYVFPLYIYEGRPKESKNSEYKKANVNLSVLKRFELAARRQIPPEELMDYVYAVLNSAYYRKEFAGFLKLEFPRIPLPTTTDYFNNLAKLGHSLIELHLGHTQLKNSSGFEVPGSNVVEKVRREDDKVFINENQYFGGITNELWDFEIGGHRLLDKWLKSRKGRALESQDIEHFIKMIDIVSQTLRLMEEIDLVSAEYFKSLGEKPISRLNS